MDDKSQIPPPVATPFNIEAVTTHLSYMRRDLDEMKKTEQNRHEEIKAKLDNMGSGFVTRIDFEEHLKADKDHEDRIRVLEKAMWKYIGFAAAGSALLSLFGSFILNKFS